jgi:hypothetical protein
VVSYWSVIGSWMYTVASVNGVYLGVGYKLWRVLLECTWELHIHCGEC